MLLGIRWLDVEAGSPKTTVLPLRSLDDRRRRLVGQERDLERPGGDPACPFAAAG
jgi:hypothetical protein